LRFSLAIVEIITEPIAPRIAQPLHVLSAAVQVRGAVSISCWQGM
jgi:hypothetical protein